MPEASPPPYIARMAVGLTPPACPPAPLKKLELVTRGPGQRTVSVKDVVNPLTDAVTDDVPGLGPACTVREARPWASVTATPLFERTTPPVAVNCTCTPEAGPWALLTCTTRGCAKVVLMMAL